MVADHTPTRPSVPWLDVNGRRVEIPAGAVPPGLTPCLTCGYLMRYADADDVCGACFGSICSTVEKGSS